MSEEIDPAHALEVYNFCVEFIRLFQLDRNLFDLGFDNTHHLVRKCRHELAMTEWGLQEALNGEYDE